MPLKLTPEDMKRSKVLRPDWYVAKVVKIEEKPSKGDGSTNYYVHFVGVSGEAAGVPLVRIFSEKYPGMAIPFLKACGANIDEESGGEFDLHKSVDKELKIHVGNRIWQNKTQNDVDDFAAL